MRDWIEWHSDELKVAAVFAVVAIGFAFLTFTEGWIHLAIFLAIVVVVPQVWSLLNDRISKRVDATQSEFLTEDQSQFSQYREMYEDELAGRTDPDFELLVTEALERIPEETKRGIPVQIVDDDVLIKSVTDIGDGKVKVDLVTGQIELSRKVVTIYSFPVRKLSAEQGIEIHDWVYRILLHEYGHAEGLSHKDMAEHGY